VIGIILFLSRITLPYVLTQTIGYVAALNTPLAMVVVRVTLAQSPIKDAFCHIKNYYPVFLRNLLVPIVTALIYALIPGLDTKLILINILSSVCPSAAVIVMFSQKFDRNVAAASQILTLSNVLSVLSIPSVMFLTQKFVELF
jgi:predicted permease